MQTFFFTSSGFSKGEDMDRKTGRGGKAFFFAQGFFSVMSHRFVFDFPAVEVDSEPKSKALLDEMARKGIGRHFESVGRLISGACEKELESAGVK